MRKSTNIVKRKAGRPATIGAEMFVGVRLPKKTVKALDAWAKGDGVSRSEAIRGIIERALVGGRQIY